MGCSLIGVVCLLSRLTQASAKEAIGTQGLAPLIRDEVIARLQGIRPEGPGSRHDFGKVEEGWEVNAV